MVAHGDKNYTASIFVDVFPDPDCKGQSQLEGNFPRQKFMSNTFSKTSTFIVNSGYTKFSNYLEKCQRVTNTTLGGPAFKAGLMRMIECRGTFTPDEACVIVTTENEMTLNYTVKYEY